MELYWTDWMLPEAWDVEHNHLHHYALGEEGDPDLVERNIKIIRGEAGVHLPMFIRYIATTVRPPRRRRCPVRVGTHTHRVDPPHVESHTLVWLFWVLSSF